MASGVFVEGHIPSSGFEDAYEMLKPGGFFVTALREKYFKEGNEWGHDRKLKELCATDKFVVLKTWKFLRGNPGFEDPLFAEQKVLMFVCQRKA